MQIQLDRETILRPLNVVAGVVERRQTLPILSYLLLSAKDGKISFTGTDLEVELVAVIDGLVERAGEVTVPARKLFDICRALPEQSVVTISKQAERVQLKSGRSRFTLSTLPTGDFPRVEGGSYSEAITVSAGALREMFEQTAFCMAQQDVRYYLNGLYLENEAKRLRAVATDGHRMAVADMECESQAAHPLQVIVPRKAVQEIVRFITDNDAVIRFEISTNHIRLALADMTFTSKLIDGKFPDYTKVIPNSQNKLLRLDRQAFRDALARVAILANEKYRGIRLNLEEGRLRLSAHNPEQEEAVEELETPYQGEPLEIGFNVTYLSEASGALDSAEILLGLNDPNSSCTLRSPDGNNTQYIIMPMRL